MIIKFIAETPAEKKRFGGAEYVEHINVKEYFIAGNKIDPDGSMVDFHEWNGSFRYLIGTIRYFYELINDDRRKSSVRSDGNEIQTNVVGARANPFIKKGEINSKLQPIDISDIKLREDIPVEEEFPYDPIKSDTVEDKTRGLRIVE